MESKVNVKMKTGMLNKVISPGSVLRSLLPGHELFKLGAGEVQTGPVRVSYRFVFRRSEVGEESRHLVKGTSTHRFMIPEELQTFQII